MERLWLRYVANARARESELSELTENVEVNMTYVDCVVTLDFSPAFVRAVVTELYVEHLQTAASIHHDVLHTVLHSTRQPHSQQQT